jgi:replicative DNA helicase
MSEDPYTDRRKLATDAEFDLLASLFRSPDYLVEARDELRIEDFQDAAHGLIFRTMLELQDMGRKSITPVDVRQRIYETGQGENAKADYIGRLAEASHYTFDPASKIQNVQSLALARNLAQVAHESVQESIAPTSPPEEALQAIRQKYDHLAERDTSSHGVDYNEHLDKFLADYDARSKGEKRNVLATGFIELDDMLNGGLQIGATTILAARPSVGKTSFALQIIRSACLAGKRVFFQSLEQPGAEITERNAASMSMVNHSRIRKCELSKDDVNRVTQAVTHQRSWKLTINDKPGMTASQISGAARRAKRRMGGIDLIVVDYIGLVTPENSKANRNEQVGQSARRIRQMGRELNAPVLLLCQLSRDSVQEEKPPKLNHLRDSGELEQVADAVLFLHRSKPRERGFPDKIELIIAKQRNGPTGMSRLEHHSHVFSFNEEAIA